MVVHTSSRRFVMTRPPYGVMLAARDAFERACVRLAGTLWLLCPRERSTAQHSTANAARRRDTNMYNVPARDEVLERRARQRRFVQSLRTTGPSAFHLTSSHVTSRHV